MFGAVGRVASNVKPVNKPVIQVAMRPIVGEHLLARLEVAPASAG